MDVIKTFGASVRDATADSLNPINNAIKNATPDTPGQVAYYLQQQLVESACEASEPGRDHWKYLNLRMEFGGSYSVSKCLTILKTLLQQGPPNFGQLVKCNTQVLHGLATADTRKDSVEDSNKHAALSVLASIGQPVSEAQLALGAGRYQGFSSEDARAPESRIVQGKTPWQEMQEQQQRDHRRKEKEMKHLKEKAIEERAAEMRRAAVSFDIEGTEPEKIVEKLVGGTRKRVPGNELKAFADAVTVSPASQAVLASLAKRIQEDSIVTRMKVLEAVVQVLREANACAPAIFAKYQKRLHRIKDARSETGMEKKTEHCAALAAEALQLIENPPAAPIAAPQPPSRGSSFSFVSTTPQQQPAQQAAAPQQSAAEMQQMLALQQQQQQLAQLMAMQQQQQQAQQQQQQPLMSFLGQQQPQQAEQQQQADAAAAVAAEQQKLAALTQQQQQLEALQQQQAQLQELQRQQQQAQQAAEQQAQLEALQKQQAEAAAAAAAAAEQQNKLAALAEQQAQLQELQRQQQQAQQAAEQQAQLAQLEALQKQQADMAAAAAAHQQQEQERQRQQAALAEQQAQMQALADQQRQLQALADQQKQLEALQQQQQPKPKLHIPSADDIFGSLPQPPAAQQEPAAQAQAAQAAPPQQDDPFASLVQLGGSQKSAVQRVPSTVSQASAASTCGSPAAPQVASPLAWSPTPVEGPASPLLVEMQKNIGDLQRRLKQMQVAYNATQGSAPGTPLPDFS